jgi:hypothetical protein
MMDVRTLPGPYAFPINLQQSEQPEMAGMLLRDYFAAKALQGLVAGADPSDEWEEPRIARWCYEMADAMLKERSK